MGVEQVVEGGERGGRAVDDGGGGDERAGRVPGGRGPGARTEDFSTRFTGTPTVVVDGTVLTPDDPASVIGAASLRAAVAKAAAAKGLPAPD